MEKRGFGGGQSYCRNWASGCLAMKKNPSEMEQKTVLEDFVLLEIYLAVESLCFTFNNKMYCYSSWLRNEFQTISEG